MQNTKQTTDKGRQQEIYNTTFINNQTEEIAHKFKKEWYSIAYRITKKTEHIQIAN